MDEYRIMKRVVQEAKKRMNEEWTLSIAENFKENKNKFSEVRKGESLRPLFMRNSMGEELTWKNGIEDRWKEYFVQLLNGNKIRKVGGEVWR